MSLRPDTEPEEILALFDKRPTVIRPGLDRIESALSMLGRPAENTPRIVIAGTNGKGTTSGMIWRMLSSIGLRAGLFTSPHLIEFRERFSVSGQTIGNDQIVDLILKLKNQISPALWSELTFFEINTILAFLLFEQMKTDVNVLEVGMGGRLDCVNVYDPDVAVITSIGFDHMEFLGHTLTAIAREKSGIMRTGRPVVWCARGWADDEADDAIMSFAYDLKAKFVRAEQPSDKQLPQSLRSRPLFFHRNFQLAKAALQEFFAGSSDKALKRHAHIDYAQVFDRDGAPWPVTFTGRFDSLTVAKGGKSVGVLLDVCHNPHGASALAGEISRAFGKKGGLKCLISVLSDKDAAGIWTALKGNIDEAIPFRSSSPRSWQVLPVGMEDVKVGPLRENFAVAWSDALANHSWRERSPWLICGSVAAVGEVFKYWRDHGWVVKRVLSD